MVREVTGLDFAAEMLVDAASRQQAQQMDDLAPRAASVSWVQGDAMSLPFEAGSFDAATMGYGLRNVADIPAALGELHRVLRPGCSAAILDFNNCTDPLPDALQAFFLERLVVPAARRYGLAAEYEYLRPSIKRFPTGPELERLARQAGFSTARHYAIGLDLMGVLVATKAKR
ncbi:Demethylmenaquinone methyltransferase [Tetrabaena socialis]|uniref:Demethylmenaquinone methyltransferase n=1 Tax=Tetrabaena socialis TaxID=47790 RepID=A0A2J8AG84_9CHLO|nr:Demethylmenaquinone methyltransferase [Tetrabaena socialis]|eukprot:PNH11512.1 Demethylmenaquinone methyltransferase [Tetrabaena socialis]